MEPFKVQNFGCFFSYVLTLLLVPITLSPFNALASPLPPTNLCINYTLCSSSPANNKPGLFPGTNLKFFPGFVISSTENLSPKAIEEKWQKIFTASPNRKLSYRPKGIYGGIRRNLAWARFYHNPKVRPNNPEDHTDPAYNWEPIDSVFRINAVKNEGAMIDIWVRDIGDGIFQPKWLELAPYNGVMSTLGPGGGRKAPKYYRYNTPDLRGVTTDANYPIVEEFLAFHKALRNHLIAKNYIDKVMMIEMEETFTAKGDYIPADWNKVNFYHGSGLRNSGVAAIWAEVQIAVLVKSVFTGSGPDIRMQYANNPIHGASYPDMKFNGTNKLEVASRFSDPITGKTQEDIRPLAQSTENNGQRDYTYFSADVPNPWGYRNVSKPQTASHILWALSGPPTAQNKDSGLGHLGDDPQGLFPVHHIMIDFDRPRHRNSPTPEEWHKAIDTFGPPGTGAFPYLPVGYQP